MKKIIKQILAGLLAIMVLLSLIPFTILAAPAADIPLDMLDNVYLDALAYTGYSVNTQKDNGTIFKTFGSSAPAAVRSNIGYGTSASGLETVADSSTVTGYAPNISYFDSVGLCCASYVTYVYYNYMPNVAGIDTSICSAPSNTKAAQSYNDAAVAWVNAGKAREIAFTQNANGSNFVPTEDIPIGSLVVFQQISGGRISHVAVYAGQYNGNYFVTHVGNDRGPEISTIVGMSKGDSPQVVTRIVTPQFIEQNGKIEIYKKDTEGNNLSGAYFVATSSSDSSLQFEIGPTDSSGYACVEGVPFDTYSVKETVFPTNYQSYGVSEWTVTINSQTPNGTVTINAVNELIPGSCKIVKTSEDGKVDGIKFTISGNGVSNTVTTANGGQVTVDGLKPGTYTVTEETIDKYEPQEVRTVTVVSNQTATVTFNNILKRGDLKVIKSSEDNMTEGIQFKLSGTSLSGNTVEQFAVTDSNGVAQFEDVLISGDVSYVLEEVNTPIKYVVPDKQSAVVKWNEVTEYSFINVLKKWQAEILKVDGELYHLNGGGVAPVSSLESDEIVSGLGSPYGESQGDASLEGAVYGLYNGDLLIDTYTTDENGYFLTDFYPCGYNWNIREITPSEGYLLDDTVYQIDAFAEFFTVERNALNYTVYEQVKKGNILIAKHSDIAPDGADFDNPEQGAEFEVYLKSSGSYVNAKESERDILITDKDGFAISQNLPYGIYTVKQTKGTEGTDIMKPFDVYIDEDGEVYKYMINNAIFESLIEIVKKDAETGKTIPASGIGFKIRDLKTNEFIVQHINYPTPKDLDVFYTNENGTLMLPEKLPYGEYEIIEQCAPDGYVLDKTPVKFTVDGTKDIVTVTMNDIPQKGIIKVSKTGEIFTSVTRYNGLYKPFYTVEFLEGAVFRITAAEDIVTPEGTVRFKEGEVVGEITTTKDGKAESVPLYLGKYQVQEIKAPVGMVINSEPQTVELTYAGQEIELTEIKCSFFNERQKLKINLKKELERDFGLGEKELFNVHFALYAAEEIRAADGTFVPKDGLMEIAQCDKEGNITFKTDLPVGSKVYIREYATDNHYVISNEIYPVEFVYAGQDKKEVEVSVNDGKSIVNKLFRGTVIGKKTDENGNALKGVTFGLFRSDETEFTKEKALLISVSGADGMFSFDNVPYGIWLVRELETVEGYVLNEEPIEVNIDSDGCKIEITVVNEKTPFKSPQTGDNSKPWIPASAMVLSGVSAIGISSKLKKRKED